MWREGEGKGGERRGGEGSRGEGKGRSSPNLREALTPLRQFADEAILSRS